MNVMRHYSISVVNPNKNISSSIHSCHCSCALSWEEAVPSPLGLRGWSTTAYHSAINFSYMCCQILASGPN